MSTPTKHDPLRIYTWVLCTLIFVGEALTLLMTDKFWPQGMDEFMACASLLALTARPLTRQRLGLMMAPWWYLFGSTYTMFFSRIDYAHGGQGERLGGLLAIMTICAVGGIWTYRRQQLLGAQLD